MGGFGCLRSPPTHVGEDSAGVGVKHHLTLVISLETSEYCDDGIGVSQGPTRVSMNPIYEQ